MGHAAAISIKDKISIQSISGVKLRTVFNRDGSGLDRINP
jgi:hypothetical protein